MNYKKTKLTCYFTYLATASIFALPPMLFMVFRQMYGISFTLLGTLVLINFCTQLVIDLIFSFFSKHFNIHTTLKVTPLLTSLGLALYAIIPTVFPRYAYAGLVAGTVLFSVSAGLCEVLLSPTVAALPSDTPEKDMTTLHSLYGYGVVSVVVISSVFLKIFGIESWTYLTLLWAILPLISCALFCTCDLPPMALSQPAAGKKKTAGRTWLSLCVVCIFLGGASENVMTNWISTYLENALGIDKATGDILGLCLFAILLSISRSLYAKFGKKIYPVLLCGMAGAAVCYLTAGLSPAPVLSLIACVLTGACTSMLWPGTLIFMEDHYPQAGVTAYALMAAGGDLGSSVAPQLLGIVVDHVTASSWASDLAQSIGASPEQIGIKTGMLISTVFPICGFILLLVMHRYLHHKQSVV